MSQWELQLADKVTQINVTVAGTNQLSAQWPFLKGKKVLILTDQHVAPLYLKPVETQLTVNSTVITQIIPAGEATKNLAEVQKCYQLLIDHHFTRQDYILCLGGGVIGDLGALVASTYMRGLHLLQLPTTIVAQSDSSIGGKTAIDYQQMKNLIGTFYPAEYVLVDPNFLLTLPQRELAAGLVEVIKSLLISDQPEDQELLTSLTPAKLTDLTFLGQLVQRGLKIKTKLATIDFYDFKERRYLNFGHTIGHAVEALADGQLHHGEAVSIGMVAIMQGLVAHEQLSVAVLQQTESLLKSLQLPTEIPSELTHGAILAKMRSDKKTTDQGIELVLIHDVGQPYLQKMTFSEFKQWLGW